MVNHGLRYSSAISLGHLPAEAGDGDLLERERNIKAEIIVRFPAHCSL